MRETVQTLAQQLPWAAFLPDLARWTLEEAIRIQQIPAPTFDEALRAAYVRAQFERLGLEQVMVDEVHNVTGVLAGARRGPGLLIMAHTDTVFPAGTDLTVTRQDGDTAAGPGLGDNSLGVAGMLALLHYLHQQRLAPPCDLWFAATSCEEGLGDLRGVRAVFARLRPHVGAVINLEGMALGHVYHAGIASHRLRIRVMAEGGHSWLHFGRPNAIHILVQIAARISELAPPAVPRTTFNIGEISGGQSVNSIAASACLLLDLRSESQDELERLKAQVRQIIQTTPAADATVEVEVVGDRPAGAMPPRHTLVLGALQALREAAIEGTLEAGSTDGNIPLHEGCPCVTIGITRGGNAHRPDEFIHVPPIQQGVQQLLLLTLAASEAQAARRIEGF